jgi:hypothetical protein
MPKVVSKQKSSEMKAKSPAVVEKKAVTMPKKKVASAP